MANFQKTTHQTVEHIDPKDSRGTQSNKAVLKKLFSNSPIHSGQLTKDNIGDYCAQFLLGRVDDGGYGVLGEVERGFSESPNLADTQTGEGGLPASPYVPNPSSPTQGLNPASIPAAPEGYGTVPSDTWGNGNGHASPHETAAGMSHGWKDLPIGKSSHNG